MIKQYLELEEQAWDTMFEPTTNHITGEGQLFETYGRELEFVSSVPEEYVWTLTDGEEGGMYIHEGMRLVNRIGYYITAKPWSKNSSYSVCVQEGECAPNQHEWEGFIAIDNPSDVFYICDKCDLHKDELEARQKELQEPSGDDN
jgi:hypothetical protein